MSCDLSIRWVWTGNFLSVTDLCSIQFDQLELIACFIIWSILVVIRWFVVIWTMRRKNYWSTENEPKTHRLCNLNTSSWTTSVCYLRYFILLKESTNYNEYDRIVFFSFVYSKFCVLYTQQRLFDKQRPLIWALPCI